jgi:putative ABC transport system substrate-binding protein
MKRRDALGLIVAAPLTGGALAQAPRPRRVAWVSPDRPAPNEPSIANFRRGLGDLGHAEGRDVTIDYYGGEGSTERLRQLVPVVIATRPDVIVATGGPVLQAFMEANVSQPVVFTMSGDAVAAKAVSSYARPGVNRSGISFFGTQLIPKRLALLKEIKPSIRRLGIVGWSRHAGESLEVAAATGEAKRLGWAHDYHPVDSVAQLDEAFAALARWRPDAVLAFADAISAAHAQRFSAFGERQRVPCISAWAMFAQRGNLMTYGPNLEESYARLATYVDRVLKGARLADMPVEQPRTIELVVNRRTAKELGIALPPSLLARANQILD